MESAKGIAQSAAVLLNFSGAEMTILMRAFGHPEQVRKALRAACSHRRTIVSTRPNTFVGNCYIQLGKQAQDVAEFWNGREAYDLSKQLYAWNYVIQPEGLRDEAFVHMYSKGAQQPTRMPLFSFLGTEYRRQYIETIARKQALKGRPRERYLMNDMWKTMQGLTPKQRARYERLAKARAAKAGKRVQEQQSTTKEQSGIPLGLKHKPSRKVHVDFTEVMTPMAGLSKRDRMELDPEYEHELDQLYGTESGAQP